MEIDATAGPNPNSGVVLLIGDCDRSEMRSLVAWLENLVATSSRLVKVSDIPGIATKLAENEFPDLIVLLQSWPNEFPIADIDHLFAFAPLARIVACYGAWCESDGRNHKHWPMAVRVPVWNARQRLTREWNVIHGEEETPPLPWSASREEIFAADHPPIVTTSVPQKILIETPDPAYRLFLRELLESAGYTIVECDPTVIVFDADPWCPTRTASLRDLIHRYPTAVIHAIASMIQPELVAELTDLGVSKVVAKLGEAMPL